jgi:protein involved in polysaccharide export with SLBB domain
MAILIIRQVRHRMQLGKLVCVAMLILPACASGTPVQAPGGNSSATATGATTIPLVADSAAQCNDAGALRELAKRRSQQNESVDYPVGPGDVLNVSVGDLPEINKLEVRVGGDGAISLPMMGTVQVNGMSEDRVSETIAARASDYVRHPRVHAFVEHYRSRSVEVMGMVSRPGAYLLSGPKSSLLDMIGRAGGMITGSAQRVVLFPANPNGSTSIAAANGPLEVACADNGGAGAVYASGAANSNCTHLVGSGTDTGTATQNPTAQQDAQRDSQIESVVLDLTRPGAAACLNIPARPGDVVLIPAAGQVGVYGWVEKPGSFIVTPGMTVAGAIAAAGGPDFSKHVVVLRTTPDGQRHAIEVNLANVEKGEDNPLVQGGDLVLVKASALGAVPYALYILFSHFGSGVAIAAS